ncbi:hypothetical protein EI613_23920 [Azospirillum sp. 412522]|nr:hypothetical protein [Azospirillum sp. 412522]MBY6264943.1 hypothetical protein [Azospirillum sp. 412522]
MTIAGIHPDSVLILAIGNHLTGLPRNSELRDQGARLVGTARTERCYRLLARGERAPFKPGLVEVDMEAGSAIDGELYELPSGAVDRLASLVQSPIRIGRVRLESGMEVYGYLCDPAEAPAARDISPYGGWRAFLAANDLGQ